jgi:UPF0271 protein
LKGKVDLNADMGESYGTSKVGSDEELVKLITSASLACGFHGGDLLTMKRTVELCRRNGVMVGAHPSFPDREGFGRREMEMPPDEVEAAVLYQVSALQGFTKSQGLRLQHVKPHGALYNMAWGREDYAKAIVAAVRDVSGDLILVALSGSVIEMVAKSAGLAVAREGFPERGYLDDGRLAPRGSPGALITNPTAAAERAAMMVTQGCVESISGRRVAIQVDTLCIHSDTPGAPAIAGEIRRRLKEEDVEVLPLGSLLGSRQP